MISRIRTFLLSPYLMLLSFLISSATLFLDNTARIYGLIILAELVALILILSDDLSAVFLPIMNIIVVGTTMLAELETLLPYIPWAFPVIPALFFHFVKYRKSFHAGPTYYALLLTSLAILLSGAGNLGATDYSDLVTLYYLSGMTVGLLGLYYVFSVTIKREKDYDSIHYYLTALCFLGLLCAVVVCRNLLSWIYSGESPLDILDYFSAFGYRNTIANLLIISLPAPFYFAAYVVKHPLSHIGFYVLGGAMFCALFITVTRTAMIFGTLLFLICMIYYLRGKESWYFKAASIVIVLFAVCLIGRQLYEPICELFEFRFLHGIASSGEDRFVFLQRSVEDFLRHPIFGIGFASPEHSDVYSAPGCVVWYHLYFPQIWGSLGLVGCLAYAYQFFVRARLALHRPNAGTIAVVLTYIGLFLYSQTDPGEFIPLPFAALGVLMFVLLEWHAEKNPLPKKGK